MKIAIIGYSGSGKSTLARILAEKYGVDVLHFDTVQFLPNWEIRNDDEKKRITKDFLDTHESWVIDGNYSKQHFDRRMREADRIIFMNEGVILEDGTPDDVINNPKNERTKAFLSKML